MGAVAKGTRTGLSGSSRTMGVFERDLAATLGCVVALAYASTAAPLGHALDAGELTSAGVLLGIGHPPGQPLCSLVMRAVAMLPLGPLYLRAALASCLAGGAAAALTYRAVERLLGMDPLLTMTNRRVLAVVAALLFALGPPLWQQAVRPEVYALQALAMAGMIEGVSRLAQPTAALASSLAVVGLWAGLGAANHHLLTLLVLPAVCTFALRVRRRPPGTACAGRGLRAGAGLPLAAGFLSGLGVYLYLPLRAMAGPALNLGQPDSAARFWWVVSARAFQGSALGTASEPLDDRMADGLIALLEHGTVPCALALGGAYLLLRRADTRPVALLSLVLLVVPLLARVHLGFIAGNPDALGYLLPCFWALSLLAVVVPGALLARRSLPVPNDRGGGSSLTGRRGVVGAAWTVALAGLVLVQAQRGAGASLARAFAPFELEVARREALPSRAVVLLFTPQSAFLHWGGAAVDGGRPDVQWVTVPMMRYPRFTAQLAKRIPHAAGLLEGLSQGRLSRRALDRVRAQRPVLTELDARVPAALWPALTPDGLAYRVDGDPTRSAQTQDGAGDTARVRHRLQRAVQRDAAMVDGPSLELLLWHDLYASLYWLSRQRAHLAADQLAQLSALGPLPSELANLRALLAPAADGDAVPAAALRLAVRLRRRMAEAGTRFRLVP